MATVTGFTAARMQNIEDGTVVDGEVVGGNLILTKHDGSTIDAGPVLGPVGPAGPTITGMPGEIKLWSDDVDLPDETTYGIWTWANGGIFDVADYPLAAAHISPSWKTAMGLADPGAGKFRVPDLRGLVPAGLDALPNGSARVNRMTRSVAIVLAGKTGKETHIITGVEMPGHTHALGEHWHLLEPHTHPFSHGKSGGVIGSGFTALKESTSGTLAPYNTGAQAVGNPSLDGSKTKNIVDTFGVELQNGYAGGDTAHENTQPTIFVPYIVKLDD